MYYELYVDSLIIINFIMNMCLLILTDRYTGRTATRTGILIGGIFGTVCFIVPMLCMGHYVLKMLIGTVVGALGMIFLSFNIRSCAAFMKIILSFIKYSFLLGGSVLFFEKILGNCVDGHNSVLTIAAEGIIVTILLLKSIQKKERETLCSVVLRKGNNFIETTALIDSGNSLMEPISGEAVSILKVNLFNQLMSGDELYRLIPFKSVGTPHGMLRGYRVDEIVIERSGLQKKCENVWIAVDNGTDFHGSAEDEVGLILNPQILEQ